MKKVKISLRFVSWLDILDIQHAVFLTFCSNSKR